MRPVHAWGLRAPSMRLIGITAMGALLVGSVVSIALAHKGKLPEDALTLVKQAAALLAQDPTMAAEVRERLDAALQSKDPRGVDLLKVGQARDAVAAGNVVVARRALAEAVIPTSGPPVPSAQPAPSPEPGAKAGSMPMALPSPGLQTQPQRPAAPTSMEAMKMAEPLIVRFGGTPAEIATLAVALGLAVTGFVVLRGAR